MTSANQARRVLPLRRKAGGPGRAARLALAVLLVAAGCNSPSVAPETDPPLFERLPPEATGVAFANHVPADDPVFNFLNYLYYYDGGGVAVGDVNGDGRVDLYFTASMDSNRLYLNRGGMRFEDVTARAGTAGTADWTKGVTMADVNGDGHLDLYVSAVNHLGKRGTNQLFINNGDGSDGIPPTFTDRAADYGLDFAGYGTQAAFFDYDSDGDLDAYLLNHSVHTENTFGQAALRYERHPRAGDRLYRNDAGSGPGQARHFTDVSEAAGIYGGRVGYGLGVAVSDLNGDGWPDLYVANDFHENDYLYVNNGDGTFTESIRQAIGHTSQSSMGTDAADVNNDGRPDLIVVDMLPAREDILKTSEGADPYDVYQTRREFGYYEQYARNTLQLNRGALRFSDVAYLAGVEATDWSWASLFADLDNDGFKDLFVTNGIYHRPNDRDYLRYVAAPDVQASLRQNTEVLTRTLIDRMPHVAIPNFAFRNNGDLTFTDRAAAWGLGEPGFSNGAAYADLDDDGDLDLVVNNLNAPASIYENHADSLLNNHFLTVTLEGDGANTGGIGAGVLVRAGGQLLLQEQMPTRGWQSSVDPRLHFGLGPASRIDTLTVIWPDRRYQVLTGVAGDRHLTLRQAEAGGTYERPHVAPEAPLFEDVTEAVALPYAHVENSFIDFSREALIPHFVSTEGPALAVGDVNGDGLDDVFAGGAKWQPASLLLQQPDGRFAASNEALWRADSLYEDVDAAFFDADADGDLDLYVVSGGNEFWGEAPALRDRLYINDGRGAFRQAEAALPAMHENGCCVAPGDYDGDGDVDLFVGGRVVARRYGLAPRSYLLENDGTGGDGASPTYTDVTTARADGLDHVGLVTDAAWADLDGDGRQDLVVVGEWMPVRVFAQQADGRFSDRTGTAGLAESNGWWRSVLPTDVDGDGDVDLVLGNLGLNAYLRASREEPARLYVKDFDSNGSLDPILTFYKQGTNYPLASRDELLTQIPSLAEKYPTYADYGASRYEDLFTAEQRRGAQVLVANTFASAYAENQGDGTFVLRPLPTLAQLAPVNAIVADDVDADGRMDLVIGGNFYGVAPLLGHYDASYGLFLRGEPQGTFTPVDLAESRLILEGEVRALRLLRRADGSRLLLAALNNAPIQVLRVRSPASLP